VAVTPNSVWGGYTTFTTAGVVLSYLAIPGASQVEIQDVVAGIARTNVQLSAKIIRGVITYQTT
jgi:hypothetical protein